MQSNTKPFPRFWAAALVALTTFTALHAERFYVAGVPETDTVLFASQAKLEFIEGSTNSIVGFLEFDPSNTSLPVSGRVRVDARTLKTGIELRDEHMRERHLQTDKFPYIEFTLKSVSGLPAAMTPYSTVEIKVTGEFTVHGATKPVTANASASLEKSASDKPRLVITATFPIKLDDYGIPRPKALFLKLAETVNITVRFVASPDNPKIEF